MVHRATQRAAEASRLIAPARLPTAKDDLYLRMAAFSSALGILSALRAAQAGDQVANVLIANAARWGAEGPAVAAALADWVLYLESGDFLTLADETRQRCAERLWQSVAALPDTTPFAAVATAIACSADVPPDIRTALLQTADRGTFWAALVGAVAIAARPEDLQAIEAAVKDQGGVSSLPAWARAATQHVPGAATTPSAIPRPAWALEASARVPGLAAAAVAPQPAAPPTSQYPPGHTPHLAPFPMPWPTGPAPAPWAPPATPAHTPPPAPWALQPQAPVSTSPWQATGAAQPPPPPPPPRRVWAPQPPASSPSRSPDPARRR